MEFEQQNAATENTTQAAEQAVAQPEVPPVPTKFCKHCGEKIDSEAVVCMKCGKQVEELKSAANQPNIVITNTNTNTNTNLNSNMFKKEKNKWVAVLLCFFLGVWGGHKFYEGKVGMGILYLFTFGLFGIGALIDFIVLLMKPNPYYV